MPLSGPRESSAPFAAPLGAGANHTGGTDGFGAPARGSCGWCESGRRYGLVLGQGGTIGPTFLRLGRLGHFAPNVHSMERSGWEAVREMRERPAARGRSSPQSRRARESDRTRSAEVGADPHLAKPGGVALLIGGPRRLGRVIC